MPMKNLAKLAILGKLGSLVLLVFLGSLATSCVDIDEHEDSPRGNLEALWQIIDEHYCFHDYKHEVYGLDWNEVYNKYNVRARGELDDYQLFEVLTDMLSELRDGHVNLYTAFDNGRYWHWHEDYPTNFSDTLQRRYLGTDYKIASGAQYRILDDNIGYLYVGSFANEMGESSLDEIIKYFGFCNGLIVDVRCNGGGQLTAAERLAARFCHEKTLTGYMQHKTGKGHNDFSEMEAQYLEPSSRFRWQKPTVVITNREVYSAANDFVKLMKCFPDVKTVGDQTGGGSGMPFTSSLPNGWIVRFSACPTYDRNRQQIEFGIAPDYPVGQTDADFAQGRDTLIEFARKLLADWK